MPRGVYDRTKKKAAGTTSPTKKTGPKKSYKKLTAQTESLGSPAGGFETFQSYLHSLAGVVASGIKNDIVLSAIDNTIRRMEKIAEDRVSLHNAEEVVAEQTDKKDSDTAVKKRPGPKPGFKKASKNDEVTKAAAPEAPANGSFTPAPFNAPPAPPRQGA